MSSKKKAATPKPDKPVMKVGELPGMPEPDAVGRLGQNFLVKYDAFTEAKEKMEDVREELAKAMKQYKRISLKINGKTILLKHKDECDSITVKEQKLGK